MEKRLIYYMYVQYVCTDGRIDGKETGATRVDCNMGRRTHTDAPVSLSILQTELVLDANKEAIRGGPAERDAGQVVLSPSECWEKKEKKKKSKSGKNKSR